MLDNSSRRGGAFFVLWNPESRSVQLRASTPPSHLAFRSFSLQGAQAVRGDIFYEWAIRRQGVGSKFEWNVQLHLLPGCAQRQVHQPQEAYEVNFSPPAAR